MFPFKSLPETQVALALSIFLASFVYEDGATLLAATLSASGRLDPRIGRGNVRLRNVRLYETSDLYVDYGSEPCA